MIIFDTETTGLIQSGLVDLSKQPHIIEFAAIKLDDKTLEEKERLEFLCYPGISLPPKITEITRLSDVDLINQPKFSERFPDLVKFFFAEKYSVAHNHEFDSGILALELRRLKRQYKFPWPPVQFCTVASTMSLKGYRLNLTALHHHLFGTGFEEAHRAMNDVEALTKCVRKLIADGIIKL